MIDCLFDRIILAEITSVHCIAVVMLVLQTATSLMAVEKDMPLLVFKMSTSVTVPSETTYIQSSSVVYNPTNSQSPGYFGIYITNYNSKFYNCSRPIHAYGHVTVTVKNAFSFNSIASSGGGVIFSSDSVTLINCTIVNSVTVDGEGGAIYSEGTISLLNSLLHRQRNRGAGGAQAPPPHTLKDGGIYFLYGLAIQ